MNRPMTSALNAQRLHFQTFGYTVVPRLFMPDEVERYAGAPVRLLDVVDGLLGENRPWHTDVPAFCTTTAP